MAAIIKPLPSGGSDDVTGHEGASCSAPKVYGADFGDVSDWSEEVKDSETADDGDDDEEKSGTGAESPQYVTSDSGGSGEGSDDSVSSIPPFPQIDIIGAVVIVWREEGKLSGLFCAILCAIIVHSAMHTQMNRPNSSLDWVLSRWAHFTVLRFIFACIMCIIVYCMHV